MRVSPPIAVEQNMNMQCGKKLAGWQVWAVNSGETVDREDATRAGRVRFPGGDVLRGQRLQGPSDCRGGSPRPIGRSDRCKCVRGVGKLRPSVERRPMRTPVRAWPTRLRYRSMFKRSFMDDFASHMLRQIKAFSTSFVQVDGDAVR